MEASFSLADASGFDGRLEACPTVASHLDAPFSMVMARVSPLAREMASRVVRSVGRMLTIWSRLGRPRARMRSLLFNSAARTMRMGPDAAWLSNAGRESPTRVVQAGMGGTMAAGCQS